MRVLIYGVMAVLFMISFLDVMSNAINIMYIKWGHPTKKIPKKYTYQQSIERLKDKIVAVTGMCTIFGIIWIVDLIQMFVRWIIFR